MRSLDEKLQAMGARLVETCLSCARAETEARTVGGRLAINAHCGQHRLSMPLTAVCNDYVPSYVFTPDPDGVSARLETVSTPKQQWVVCTSKTCAWEGWDRDLHLDAIDAGGESWTRHCCPRCGTEVYGERKQGE